jgi:hypothetical protein
MKAQHIRPRVQNGPITRRRAPRAASNAPGAEKRPSDSRVFWLMALAGSVLTVGFLLGLRSQIAAHQLNQAEEKLKNQLDRYASQEKFLALEQQRARSPRESERARKESGLEQLKLVGSALPAGARAPLSAPASPSEAKLSGPAALSKVKPIVRLAGGKDAARKEPEVKRAATSPIPVAKPVAKKDLTKKDAARKEPDAKRAAKAALPIVKKAESKSPVPKPASGRPRTVTGTQTRR